jgi:multimeric flavodoxin WrbA
MAKNVGRRELISAAGAASISSVLVSHAVGQESSSHRKIVGVCCSPRKGMTTSASLSVCLEAAKAFDSKLETELIELADYSIPAQVAAGQPLREGEKDDFGAIIEKLGDPAVVGIIVGSPVYFGNMSALCKAFLDRCGAFRSDNFKLRNKVAGVLAVGSARNGGQELTIRSIQTALMCQDMVIVGDGQPSARIGATLWNQNNSIGEDDFGTGTARNLGKRVAELAALIQK